MLPQKSLLKLTTSLIFTLAWLVSYPSVAQAEDQWQVVGDYPGTINNSFNEVLDEKAPNCTDGSIYSLNGHLYVIIDGPYYRTTVYRLDGNSWVNIGEITKSSGSSNPGKAMTYYQDNLYAISRAYTREYIFPDGDITTQWDSTGVDHYTEVDEDVLAPIAGDTNDHIYGRMNDVDQFSLSDPTKNETANRIDIHFYGRGIHDKPDNTDWAPVLVELMLDGVAISDDTLSLPNNNWGWFTTNHANNVELTPSELNRLELKLTPNHVQDMTTYYIAAVVVEVSYDSALTAAKYISDNNWQPLGNTSLDCDDTGSAYFSCNTTGVTGFWGYNNKLYVGTGASTGPKVFEWNGSTWSLVGSSGLGDRAGGTDRGSLDLLTHDSSLVAGGMQNTTCTVCLSPGNCVPGVSCSLASIYKFNSANNWSYLAYDNDTTMTAVADTNARSLVEIASTLYTHDVNSVYKYIPDAGHPDPDIMGLVGSRRFNSPAQNVGMTSCDNYLYTHASRSSFGTWDEVYRFDTTSGTQWDMVGDYFALGEKHLYHGVHSITTLNDKVYVLTKQSLDDLEFHILVSYKGLLSNFEPYPAVQVWEYTGAAGSCGAVNGTISGVVFEDEDLDGLYDTGESYKSGVVVSLNPGGLSVNSLAADPSYTFTELDPSPTYSLAITLPSGWVATTPYQVGNIVFNETTPSYTINFGLIQGGTLQGTVWEDEDKQCDIDPGEQNYTGAVVDLQFDHSLSTSNPQLKYDVATSSEITTGTNFSWLVAPGSYTVSVDSSPWAPSGYDATTDTSVSGVVVTKGGTTTTSAASCLNLE